MKKLNVIKCIVSVLAVLSITAHAADKPEAIEIMEGSRIIGSEELPKIFYVIAWQENSRHSDLFSPKDYLNIDTSLLDRDIVRRNIRLHKASLAASINKQTVVR